MKIICGLCALVCNVCICWCVEAEMKAVVQEWLRAVSVITCSMYLMQHVSYVLFVCSVLSVGCMLQGSSKLCGSIVLYCVFFRINRLSFLKPWSGLLWGCTEQKKTVSLMMMVTFWKWFNCDQANSVRVVVRLHTFHFSDLGSTPCLGHSWLPW